MGGTAKASGATSWGRLRSELLIPSRGSGRCVTRPTVHSPASLPPAAERSRCAYPPSGSLSGAARQRTRTRPPFVCRRRPPFFPPPNAPSVRVRPEKLIAKDLDFSLPASTSSSQSPSRFDRPRRCRPRWCSPTSANGSSRWG
jgi:hypothetical protein